jgi:phage terminase Nu1 subunit (DNA packaging protein)
MVGRERNENRRMGEVERREVDITLEEIEKGRVEEEKKRDRKEKESCGGCPPPTNGYR